MVLKGKRKKGKGGKPVFPMLKCCNLKASEMLCLSHLCFAHHQNYTKLHQLFPSSRSVIESCENILSYGLLALYGLERFSGTLLFHRAALHQILMATPHHDTVYLLAILLPPLPPIYSCYQGGNALSELDISTESPFLFPSREMLCPPSMQASMRQKETLIPSSSQRATEVALNFGGNYGNKRNLGGGQFLSDQTLGKFLPWIPNSRA